MSVYTAVYALESKIKAPEIGDAGHVGFPPVDSNTGQHPFNLIYAGLKCAGLVTREIDAFKAFLDEYDNERLYFSVEGDDDSKDAKLLNKIFEEQDVPKYKLDQSRNYTKCKYRISSGESTYISTHADFFENIVKLTVAKEDLTALIDNVFLWKDWEINFYKLWGVLDPYDGDLGKLKEFILNHEGPFVIEFPPIEV